MDGMGKKIMKNISLKGRKEKLKRMLSLHPAVCPKCNQGVQVGFVWGPYLKWVSKSHKRPPKDPLFCLMDEFLPAYLCEHCDLVFGISRPLERKQIKVTGMEGKPLTFCTYCGNNKLETGHIYSPRYISWSKDRGLLAARGKLVHLVAVTGFHNRRLSTRRCRNCGMFYSKFHPKKVNRSNIKWLILLLAIVAYLLLGLIFILIK